MGIFSKPDKPKPLPPPRVKAFDPLNIMPEINKKKTAASLLGQTDTTPNLSSATLLGA